MQLVLIGYRGTGKSTTAAYLAAHLGWPHLDLDEQIERRAGMSIADIFSTAGEETFRQLEHEALAETAGQDQLVLATGGGVVLRADNRQLLRTLGKVVWLMAQPATILARLQSDPNTAARRPALTAAGGGLAEIESLLVARTPLYEACANLQVATDQRSPAEVAQEILDRLNLLPGRATTP